MKRKVLLILLLLFPIQVFAYSNYLVLGGEPIGIEIHSKGVYVVDFYKVDHRFIAKDAGFVKGDFITSVDGKPVLSILELERALDDEEMHTVTVERNHKNIDLLFSCRKKSNVLETGLYVKDVINGVGTLSYVDPDTKIFASLGHEILESNSKNAFRMNNGYIFDAKINYIHKSSNGSIGELHATFMDSIIGDIQKNEVNGIYGNYLEDVSSLEVFEVGGKDTVLLGDAYIRFLVNDDLNLYSIKILDINREDKVKNILFEVTDSRLLDLTGGIVQGMSGSPILQNDKVIGVVNYVVVNDSKKGYGIFIETMLEEGDSLLRE